MYRPMLRLIAYCYIFILRITYMLRNIFILVVSSNLDPMLHRFSTIFPTPHIFRLKFGVFLLE